MSTNEKKATGDAHTLDDHLFGDFYPHEHGPDADHDHDDIDPGPLEDNPIWQQDNVSLRSVGVDIGSAGTQVAFSGIHLRRQGEDLSSRYLVVERETLFQSPVHLTPYADEQRIDERRLGEIIDLAYAHSGLLPQDIDTGVVILTGEALRRENAEGIARVLAEKGGEFVTATAGHHMESLLAAYGSGAARLSHERRACILNVDIGGGTTKLALIRDGHIEWTAALHVGGRLAVAERQRITRLDPAGAHHARRAGLDWAVGSRVAAGDFERVALGMADVLLEAITAARPSRAVLDLYLTEPPPPVSDLDGVVFSGGVAEYVYGNEQRDFGDLGVALGAVLRERALAGRFGAALLPATERIRATVLGASEYSTQLSGNTSTITSAAKVLPRRNLQVLKPELSLEAAIDAEAVAQAIRRRYAAFDLDPARDEVALAIEWRGPPAYARIRALAEGIRAALAERLRAGATLYVMLDGDIAQTLGAILREELGVTAEMLVIDGIVLRDFDFIDLGKIRLPSFTVPVTIKSLTFRDDPRGPRRERIHHRASTNGHARHGHDHSHDHAHRHGAPHRHLSHEHDH